MVGVKGRSGGARPGAGRKKKATLAYQLTNRQIIQSEVSERDVREMVGVLVSYAKAGRVEAWRELAPWILGAPPKELTVKGDDAAPLRVEVVYADDDSGSASSAAPGAAPDHR